jgi:RNA-binding protein
MNFKTIKELKEEAKKIQPTIRIGKSGLSEGTMSEIKKQLKHKKIIKIKFLNNFIEGKDKKKEIENLINLTDSELIEKKGFTITIYKKKPIPEN